MLSAPADRGVAINPAAEKPHAIDNLSTGRFKWIISPPLVTPLNRPDGLTYSVKDPTVVRYKGRWHLFCTIRGKKRSHQIEYICFEDWKGVSDAKRCVLKLSDGYFCAPQVFYFTPHGQWYMIYQIIDKSRKPSLQPAYSTTSDISDPNSWSKPKLLFSAQPENVKMWIDFWVICDSTRAHFFFTSLNGRMWRSETKLRDFPGGWSQPSIVIRGDIFEASHTYRLKGLNKFLTIVARPSWPCFHGLEAHATAQAGGRWYYKAYLAERLDGQWTRRQLGPQPGSIGAGARKDKPFAGPANTRNIGAHWTDSFSHGELIRDGYDQTLVVDPARLRLLFQGVSDEDKRGKKYGEIPWRLGMLSPAQ